MKLTFSPNVLLKCMALIGLFFLNYSNLEAQEKTPIQTETFVLEDGSAEVEMTVFNNLGTDPRKIGDQYDSQGQLLPNECNIDSEILLYNITQDDPVDSVGCNESDLLEICLKVNFWSTGGTGQWMHGLVPDFGDCVDVYPLWNGEPGAITQPMTNNSNTGEWQWFEDGVVTYKFSGPYYDFGEPVGAGWFYNFRPGSNPNCTDYTNPNCTWGDFPGTSWEVCFLADVFCVDPGLNLCEISFRAFGDGETGGYGSPGCELDEPTVATFEVNCCEEYPIILNDTLDFTVCSGETFTLDLLSNMDPETTWDWEVEPNPYGATSGSGTTISDVLINETDDPVLVIYYATPTCAFGCVGQTYEIHVTINPAPDVTLSDSGPICEGGCVTVTAVISGGGGYNGCWWSNGQSDVPTIVDCPQGQGFYSVTVSNSYGCTAENGIFVEIIPPLNVDISASSLEACENGPDFPIVLNANASGSYGGPYSYQWSSGGYTPTEIASESGTYSVTVYDNFGCYYAVAQIFVTVHSTPVISVSGPDIVCEGEEFCLEATPVGGEWSGGVTINGCGGSSIPLSPGTYSFTYNYTDENGCAETASHNVTVVPEMEDPVISCVSTETSVEFFWNDINGASGYLVNGAFQLGTSYLVDGLEPGEIVAVSVEALSSNSCPNTYADLVCMTQECPFINIEIESVDPLCQDFGTITLQSNLPGGIWTGPGIIDPLSGEFDPESASPGINVVQYTYENGFCVYGATTIVEVETPLSEPEINCEPELGSVTFSWPPINGASGYIVNGVVQQNTSYTFNNLQSGESVNINVEAVGQGVCGSSYAQANCTALDCPSIIVSITEVPTLCQTGSGIIILEASEAGGFWTGSGIIDAQNGLFDPAAAILGVNEIEYVVADGICTYSANTVIEVEAALETPEISCDPTIDAVSFSWNPVNGASGYIVNGVVQQNTNFTFNNLQPDESVSITVEAIGQGVCGNSFAQTSCSSEECPVVNLMISEVPALCQYSSGIISLQSNELGGTWSGPGIVDAENGLFNPATAIVGTNEIIYSIENGFCSYSTSLEIEVEASLTEPEISCSPGMNEVSFTWLPINGATSYIVNGLNQQNTSITFNNLLPGETVNITVEAVGTGACGSSFAQTSCASEDCPAVSLSLDPVPNICSNEINGNTIDLIATISGGNGNGIGTWEGIGIIDVQAGIFDPSNSELVNGENEVIYTYTEGGCSFSQSLMINVYQSPQVDAGISDALTCNQTSLSLNGSGDGMPNWTGPGIISGANSFTPSINEPGIYVLTITNPQTGCSEFSEIEVFQDIDAPIAQANEDQLITCVNTEATLISIGNSSLNYQVEWQGPGITTANMNDLEIVTDLVGVYSLITTNTENGCVSLPDTLIVFENTELPNLEIQAIGTLDCSGTTILLETPDQSDYVYEWTGPDGSVFSTYNIETAQEGMYNLIVTNLANGCTAADEYLLENTTEIPVSNAGQEQYINCIESVASLDGSGSESGANIQYLWTGPAGGITGSATQVQVEVLLEGYYKLRVTDNSTTCFSEDSVFVSANFDTPDAFAGADQQITCNESIVTLNGSTSAISYAAIWTNTAGQILSTSNEISTNESGWYYFSVINTESGCITIDSAFVSIDEDIPIGLEAFYETETCYGDSDAFINIVSVIGGTEPYQYAINGQAFSSEMTWQSLVPGSYQIEVMDANGCVYSQTFVIPQTPQLVFDMGPDMVIELGQSEQIDFHTNISNDAIDTIFWSTSEAFDCMDEDCNDILISPLNSMTLEAVLMDTSGCIARAELNVKVKKKRFVFIPNVFTPNGDGINDVFFIQGLEKRVKKVNRFVVTDRWGAVVYEQQGFNINDPGYGWDGFYKSKASEAGVYVYFAEVEFVDGFVAMFKGDVTLVR